MSRFRVTKMSIINYYTYLAIKLMQQFIGPNWYEQEQEQQCSRPNFTKRPWTGNDDKLTLYTSRSIRNFTAMLQTSVELQESHTALLTAPFHYLSATRLFTSLLVSCSTYYSALTHTPIVAGSTTFILNLKCYASDPLFGYE